MSCFCHQAMRPLLAALPSLNVSASLQIPQARVALAVSDWLGARALPAPPWQPDPNWLSLVLPQMRLSMSAMATISALAQLRAQVLAVAGIDLLLPGQANALARLVATLNARLAAMESVTPGPWLSLAALNGAIDQLQVALSAGLLVPSASLLLQMTSPGGQAMSLWRAFLAALGRLAPLLAAGTQLGLDLSGNFSAQLAASLRSLRGIALPPMPTERLAVMASVTAGLSAVARLQASLGINPLQLGFPAAQAMVAARLQALLPSLCAAMGVRLNSSNLLAELLGMLPALPYCPSTLATRDAVEAAMSVHAQALASMDWNVPDASALVAIRVGLPSIAFAAQLQLALGIKAVLPAPCGNICDAAAITRAAAA